MTTILGASARHFRQMQQECESLIKERDALREQVRVLSEAAELVLAWYDAEEDHSKEPDFYSRMAMCTTSGRELRAALAAVKPAANAFRNKDTHEIRYVLSNEHNEAEWEDVVITPASVSAAGQKGSE